MAKFVQYDALEKWAKDNDVSFRVDHYNDCHILSVSWYLKPVDGTKWWRAQSRPVVWGLLRYQHSGGKVDLRPWNNHGKVAEFVGMFDEMRKKAPIQPTQTLGAFH